MEYKKVEKLALTIDQRGRRLPTEALLARFAVSKLADGLPLFRREGIYAWDGVEIERPRWSCG